MPHDDVTIGTGVTTPELSQLRAAAGRIGGLVTASRHDVREQTKPAGKAFRARFEREVDPDGLLPAAERARRAQAALRAHMQRLAMRSAAVRRGTTAKSGKAS